MMTLQLRVLCLHDAKSHAQELQDELRDLGERLFEQHGIDLVYVNSPLAIARAPPVRGATKKTTTDEEAAKGEENEYLSQMPRYPQRVWWHECPGSAYCISQLGGCLYDHGADGDNEEEEEFGIRLDPAISNAYSSSSSSSSNVESSLPYAGLDASLLFLQQVWSSSPFWGILGVGQGGAIASVFSLLPTTFPPPQCLLFYHATSLLEEGTYRLSYVPCLHVVTGGDESAILPQSSSINAYHHSSDTYPKESSEAERLIRQFGGQVVQSVQRSKKTHSQKHSSKSMFIHNSDLNVMGRFLVSQQKSLHRNQPQSIIGKEGRSKRGSDSEEETRLIITQLHAALHSAQTQVGELLAQEIADNPPSSLMAVILPQHVAGWKGNHRKPRPPRGGAPCPEEFLLKREKRSGVHAGGASRHHPSSTSAPTSSPETS